jgi:hypothetical protein
MIEASVLGIEKRIKDTEDILKEFDQIHGIRGKRPKTYNPKFEITKNETDDKYRLDMDDRTAFSMKNVMINYVKITAELKNHFNSILLTYVWGAFETYILLLFQDLFTKKIDMLKSSENASYKDIIENRDNITDHIINRELDKIGHFSINDHFDYLDKKINFKFAKNKQDQLRQTYLIRNIVSHNTGIVGKNYKNQIPKSLRLKGDELLISKSFLKKEIVNIRSAIDLIEKHVQNKFSLSIKQNKLYQYDRTKRTITRTV